MADMKTGFTLPEQFVKILVGADRGDAELENSISPVRTPEHLRTLQRPEMTLPQRVRTGGMRNWNKRKQGIFK